MYTYSINIPSGHGGPAPSKMPAARYACVWVAIEGKVTSLGSLGSLGGGVDPAMPRGLGFRVHRDHQLKFEICIGNRFQQEFTVTWARVHWDIHQLNRDLHAMEMYVLSFRKAMNILDYVSSQPGYVEFRSGVMSSRPVVLCSETHRWVMLGPIPFQPFPTIDGLKYSTDSTEVISHTLWWTYITRENHHVQWNNYIIISMAIFHSYVNLPEGTVFSGFQESFSDVELHQIAKSLTEERSL